ncbi:MAG: polysaccharide biosynthesis tyrosine autokinase [Mariprofundaceae bacterium]|nr:polysaccharide biosynthesis tyrosine autokinase [Mariprofundaceae bacterium]
MMYQNNKEASNKIHVSYQDDVDNDANINLWLAIINEAKWRILTVALLGAIASAFLHYISMPKFEIKAMMYASNQSSTIPGLEGIPGLGMDSSPALTEAQILLTKQTIGEVVETLKLSYYTKPHYLPLIGEGFARHFKGIEEKLADPLFWFDSFSWGGERIHLESFDVSNKWINVSLSLLVLGQGRYRLLDEYNNILLEGQKGELSSKNGITLLVSDLHARIGTSFDIKYLSELTAIEEWRPMFVASEDVRGSNVLHIRCVTNTPEKAVLILNQLLHQHIQNNIEFSSAQSEKGVQFIMLQLPELRKKLKTAQYELNEYLRIHKMVNISFESTSLLNKIVEQETKISDLEIIRLDLLHAFTSENNKIRVLDGKLKHMRHEKDKMQQEVKNMPKKTQEVEALERNVQIASDLYIALLNRMQELRIAKASDAGNLRIVDKARIPEKTISLSMPIMIILGTIAGFLIGLTGVLWRRLINDNIDNADDIEKLGLTVLANIPHSREQKKTATNLTLKPNADIKERFLSLGKNNDLTVESLRSLRTSLHFSLSKHSTTKKRMMISGSRPESGKSFISINLAQLFHQSGQKVLIIDADIRRGYLNKYYNISNTPGLADALSGAVEIQEAIHYPTEDLADILTTGTRVANPSELFMQPKFSELLDKLSQTYDLIIIDTPPVLAVTDALIIGNLVDESIVVLRSGDQNSREVQQMIQRFSHSNISLLGAVFNDIPANAMAGSGTHGYGYHYQYQYAVSSKS